MRLIYGHFCVDLFAEYVAGDERVQRIQVIQNSESYFRMQSTEFLSFDVSKA